MFWNILANENTKTFKRSMLWVELGLLALLIFLIFGVVFATLEFNLGAETPSASAGSEIQQTLTWPHALVNMTSIASGNALGGLLLIILVGAVTAQEYTWRSLHLWLSRGTPRPILVAAKFAALLLPALMIVLTALIAGGTLSALFSIHLLGRLPIEQVNFVQLALSLVRTTYTLLPYAALTFLLAILSRSVVVAVGAGLAYSLLIEGVLVQLLSLAGGTFAKIMQFLPAGLAQSLMGLNGSAAMVDVQVNGATAQPHLLGPVPAAIGIAAWTLLLLGLALLAFQRQDLSE